MLKRLIQLFIFVIFSAFLLNISAVATTRRMPKDLDEIASESDTVVIGYVLDDARQVEKYDEISGISVPAYAAHKTTLHLVDVIKGGVFPDEEIQIIESYSYSTKDGEKRLIRHDSYGPSKPGRTYLFFLMDADLRYQDRDDGPPDIWKGAYLLGWGDLSRYPIFVEAYSVGNSESQPEDFDLIPNTGGMSVAVNFDTYLEFYKEAMQTYISKGDWQAQYPIQEKSGYSITVLAIALIVVLVVGTIIFIRVKR